MLLRTIFTFSFLITSSSLFSQNSSISISVIENNVSGGGFQSDVTITEDGNTIYSAADVSGIFKSTDGGITFGSINEGLKSPKVASIAITPDNDQILYAGTGDKGGSGGLFRSTNGGASWVLTTDGNNAQFAGNHSAAEDPIPNGHPRSNGDLIIVDSGSNQASYSDDIVIAGTYKTGVRIFEQGGDEEVSAVNTNGFVRSVAFDPSLPNMVFAAIQFDNSDLNGIYKIDYTDPLSPISTLEYQTTLPEGVTVLSSGHVYAAISQDGIVKYNGNSWFLVNSGLDTGNSLRTWTAVTGYVKGSTDVIYAGVNNLGGNQSGTNYSSVWRSKNGGTSWEPLVDADDNVQDQIYGQTYDWWYRTDGFPQAGLGRTNNVVSSIDVALGVFPQFVTDDVIYVSGRGGIWKSEHGGDLWEPAVFNMQATANNGVAVNPNETSQVVVANTDYVLLESINAFTESDISRDKPNGSESKGYDVTFDKKDDDLILGTGDRDSNVGGEVYIKSAATIGNPSDSGWLNTELNTIVDKRVLAVASGHHNGNTPTNQTIIAAVEDEGVYRYHNGSWSFTGLIVGNTKRCNLIWPDNENSGIVYLLDLLGGLFRSNNGGQSWTNIWPSMSFNNNDFYNSGYLTADDSDPSTIYISTQGRNTSPIGTAFKVYRLNDADSMIYGAPGSAGITDITTHSGNTTIKRPGPLVIGPNGNLWLTEQQNSANDIYASFYVMEDPTEDLTFMDITTDEYRDIAIQPSGIDVSSDGYIYVAQNGTGLVKIQYSKTNLELNELCIEIHPDPSNTLYTISGLLVNYNIDIIDANGNIYSSLDNTGSVISINTDTLPPGIYRVRVTDANNTTMCVEKIIKS